ncbi:LCP family protein [Streptomyces sp. VRA16 Mangrove soil]|uniref:LCP family protein n=1 Tax=Streptomyces sp. VRA16 Mangrove soil TaxID=2817434 RepID=UPI001A9E7772|nr:LCP family protein [Streptomyces sp. VRA16 Mangrove soil]MBO1333641.1 LCP family protein [Streptomyces sp. VRA16 Mangrove soil]
MASRSPRATRTKFHRLLPRRRGLRWGLFASCLLLVTAVCAGGFAYARLSGGIRTDETADRTLAAEHGSRPVARAPRAQNILLMGSDIEATKDSQRSDTTMLLHLSADRKRAALVSVPRDLMVDIPACRTWEGERSEPEYAQFNWAFERGGSACAIRTFEDLTGVRVDHHLVVDFTGFEEIVDALGGIDVKVPQRMRVPGGDVVLDKGKQHLDGAQALVFVRGRTGVGDGSDLQRIERQKEFARVMMHHVRQARLLDRPAELYDVLDAVTSSLTADRGLDSLPELGRLAKDVGAVPERRVAVVTVPSVEHPDYWGRYMPVEDQADALFEALREDRALPAHLYNAYDPDNDEL